VPLRVLLSDISSIPTREHLLPQPEMTMLQKDEVEQTTGTTAEAVVGARRRKRKVKTRTESLDRGLIASGCATVEQTHLNSLLRNAVTVTRATVVTICGSILRMEDGKI
jgi:hypothetical protein